MTPRFSTIDAITSALSRMNLNQSIDVNAICDSLAQLDIDDDDVRILAERFESLSVAPSAQNVLLMIGDIIAMRRGTRCMPNDCEWIPCPPEVF